ERAGAAAGAQIERLSRAAFTSHDVEHRGGSRRAADERGDAVVCERRRRHRGEPLGPLVRLELRGAWTDLAAEDEHVGHEMIGVRVFERGSRDERPFQRARRTRNRNLVGLYIIVELIIKESYGRLAVRNVVREQTQIDRGTDVVLPTAPTAEELKDVVEL